MPSRHRLLDALIKALIEEWGREKVEASIKHVCGEMADRPQKRPLPEGRFGKHASTALSVASRIEIDDERRKLILEIAERYDQREFLPNMEDWKEFMILAGRRSGGARTRTDAFKLMLPHLRGLSVHQLNELIEFSRNTGPSRLGPISDAISEAGRRRSHEGMPKAPSEFEEPPDNSSDAKDRRAG